MASTLLHYSFQKHDDLLTTFAVLIAVPGFGVQYSCEDSQLNSVLGSTQNCDQKMGFDELVCSALATMSWARVFRS